MTDRKVDAYIAPCYKQVRQKQLLHICKCRAVIFLGVRPASYTHHFTRGRKKLASVSPRDSYKTSNVRTFCFLKSTFIFGKSECASGVSVQCLVKPSTGRHRISTVHRFYLYGQIINTKLSSTRGKLSRH